MWMMGLYEALILATCRLAFLKQRRGYGKPGSIARVSSDNCSTRWARLFRFDSVKPGARMPIWALRFAGRPDTKGRAIHGALMIFDD